MLDEGETVRAPDGRSAHESPLPAQEFTANAQRAYETAQPTVTVIDPFSDRGRWWVTTRTGARHVFDSCDPQAVTLTLTLTVNAQRSAQSVQTPPGEHHVPVFAVDHVTVDGDRRRGIAIGAPMHLVLELHDPISIVTFMRTEPVATIAPLLRCETVLRWRTDRGHAHGNGLHERPSTQI